MIRIIVVLIAVILVVVGIFVAIATKKKNEEIKKTGKYPEGHFIGMWMGIGIAIFTGVGVPLSIATKNIGLIGIGPAIGVAFGLSIGQSIENKYKKEGKIRPLTEEEKKRKKVVVTIGLVTLLLGVIAFSLFYFFKIK